MKAALQSRPTSINRIRLFRRTCSSYRETSPPLSFLFFRALTLGEVPGLAISTDVSAELLRRIVDGNLMRGGGQRLAFGVVLALARYGAFGFEVHSGSLAGNLPAVAKSRPGVAQKAMPRLRPVLLRRLSGILR